MRFLRNWKVLVVLGAGQIAPASPQVAKPPGPNMECGDRVAALAWGGPSQSGDGSPHPKGLGARGGLW